MKTRADPANFKKPRKWYNYWPLLIIVVETVLNTDWVITPVLMKRGIFFDLALFSINWDLSWILPELSHFGVFVWISIISVPTSLGWYWLWRWIGGLIVETAKEREAVQEAIGLWAKIIAALKRGGIIELAKEWFISTFKWATDDNNRWLNYLRRGGYTALFIISALPVSGGRLVATIFCLSADPIKGLTLLILGETLKNIFIIYGFWNLIFWLFSKI